MLTSSGAGPPAAGPLLELDAEPPAACPGVSTVWFTHARSCCLCSSLVHTILKSFPAFRRMHLRLLETCRTTFCATLLDLTFQSDVHSAHLWCLVFRLWCRVPGISSNHLSQRLSFCPRVASLGASRCFDTCELLPKCRRSARLMPGSFPTTSLSSISPPLRLRRPAERVAAYHRDVHNQAKHHLTSLDSVQGSVLSRPHSSQ